MLIRIFLVLKNTIGLQQKKFLKIKSKLAIIKKLKILNIKVIAVKALQNLFL